MNKGNRKRSSTIYSDESNYSTSGSSDSGGNTSDSDEYNSKPRLGLMFFEFLKAFNNSTRNTQTFDEQLQSYGNNLEKLQDVVSLYMLRSKKQAESAAIEADKKRADEKRADEKKMLENAFLVIEQKVNPDTGAVTLEMVMREN